MGDCLVSVDQLMAPSVDAKLRMNVSRGLLTTTIKAIIEYLL